LWVPLLHDCPGDPHGIRHGVLPPRLHLMVHDFHMVSLGHYIHSRLRPNHVVPPLQITCSVKCVEHRTRGRQSGGWRIHYSPHWCPRTPARQTQRESWAPCKMHLVSGSSLWPSVAAVRNLDSSSLTAARAHERRDRTTTKVAHPRVGRRPLRA
jgi:hypothetical protein